MSINFLNVFKTVSLVLQSVFLTHHEKPDTDQETKFQDYIKKKTNSVLLISQNEGLPQWSSG